MLDFSGDQFWHGAHQDGPKLDQLAWTMATVERGFRSSQEKGRDYTAKIALAF
jgi:hypothetical protein